MYSREELEAHLIDLARADAQGTLPTGGIKDWFRSKVGMMSPEEKAEYEAKKAAKAAKKAEEAAERAERKRLEKEDDDDFEKANNMADTFANRPRRDRQRR